MPFYFLQYYSYDDPGIGLGSLILLLIILILVYTFIKASRMKKVIHSHWHHMFDVSPFGSQELYQQIVEIIATKEIPNLTISKPVYSQGGPFAPNREYLQVKYKECAFDICAAPFGKGYFVSWWMWVIEGGDPIRDFMASLPLIGRLFTKRTKTFYELDTELMFKETVKDCVKNAIEALTEQKGLRKLTGADWDVHNRSYTS